MKEFTAHQDIFLEEFIQVNAPTLSNVSMNELEIDFKKYGPLRFENSKFNKVLFSWFTGNSTFSFVDITNSNLDDSRMESTVFENTNILNSSFRKNLMNKCIFRQSVLENCDFRNTEASFSEFTNCKLQFIDLSYCEFRSCFFKIEDFSATLSNTNFIGCTFLRVPFTKLDLDVCKFENCIFIDCELDAYQVKRLNMNNMFIKKWSVSRKINTENISEKQEIASIPNKTIETPIKPVEPKAPSMPSKPIQPTRFDALEFEGMGDEL
ncbi:MAG: pentapeptide repeat-containing protein [Halobacteriovoraceae bacterium]|nr:pentapeptide repeat-containing protein [Halobacteriovoraceae bacterium]